MGEIDASFASFEWERCSYLTELSAKEVKKALVDLVAEETKVSYRCHVLQSRIDLLGPEFAGYGESSVPAKILAQALIRQLNPDDPDGSKAGGLGVGWLFGGSSRPSETIKQTGGGS